MKRKLLIAFSLFYVALCGGLGIDLSKEQLNIDITTRIAVLIILVFNMFLPFFMLYIWELEDKLLKKSGEKE